MEGLFGCQRASLTWRFVRLLLCSLCLRLSQEILWAFSDGVSEGKFIVVAG